MSDYSRKITMQTALIAEEIERTRQICARSLELLRLPLPSTFLGNKPTLLAQPSQLDERRRNVEEYAANLQKIITRLRQRMN
ncbi:hypothetical protein JQ581_29705 [Bradyrhizobium liaoningense]|uniref:hypothetical protein n=1 Tax=Bradyrhizobium liaoningense TaxID=43992 RepID=UPI001BAD89DA|nr:hypothetical protein [Bradyrhizobium liaoningense]MBR0741115.1 hypothetical protein [Bradyrhizobium liaoningense]